MSLFLSKIGQIAVFLICAQTILHFRAKASYEKYIKLLVSMMLLILLAEPIFDLFAKGEDGGMLENIQIYEEELQGILENQKLENDDITNILVNIAEQKVKDLEKYAPDDNEIEKVESVMIEVEYGKSAENH